MRGLYVFLMQFEFMNINVKPAHCDQCISVKLSNESVCVWEGGGTVL